MNKIKQNPACPYPQRPDLVPVWGAKRNGQSQVEDMKKNRNGQSSALGSSPSRYPCELTNRHTSPFGRADRGLCSHFRNDLFDCVYTRNSLSHPPLADQLLSRALTGLPSSEGGLAQKA